MEVWFVKSGGYVLSTAFRSRQESAAASTAARSHFLLRLRHEKTTIAKANHAAQQSEFHQEEIHFASTTWTIWKG